MVEKSTEFSGVTPAMIVEGKDKLDLTCPRIAFGSYAEVFWGRCRGYVPVDQVRRDQTGNKLLHSKRPSQR